MHSINISLPDILVVLVAILGIGIMKRISPKSYKIYALYAVFVVVTYFCLA